MYTRFLNVLTLNLHEILKYQEKLTYLAAEGVTVKLRLSFNVSGENFNTQLCIERLYSNELKAEYDVDCPNHLSWVHPNEFTDYHDYDNRSAYEKAYLDFIITNINILDRCGADDFSIFTEI